MVFIKLMHKQQMDILCPLVVNLTLRLNRKWKKAAIIYYCKKQVTVFIVLWFYMILSFLVQESVSMYKDLILCVSITSCI